MKKIIPVLAALLLGGGYLMNHAVNPKYHFEHLQSVTDVPAQIMDAKKEGIAPYCYIQGTVEKVADGDTIEVSYKHDIYKVRLLDLDTPESVKNNVKVQEYGKEASQFTKKQVLHRPVKLVFEKGLRDKYGRLLAHIFLKDGTYYNALLVRNGFARVEIVKPNLTYANYFYKLQEQAISDKLGVWSLPADKQPFIKDSQGEYVPRYWLEEGAS